MRSALFVLLVACGGSPKTTASPPPPPPPVEAQPAPPPEAPPPVEQPTTIATNVPAPPPADDQTRAPAMTGDPCEGGQVVGTSGFGPGAGGTGQPGGMKLKKPVVAIGMGDAKGSLDKQIIRRYVKRNINKIQYCYEKELLSQPGIGGTLKVEFVIGTDGRVETSTATGVVPVVADCVAKVIKDIEFPAPKGGKVSVTYPFTFTAAAK